MFLLLRKGKWSYVSRRAVICYRKLQISREIKPPQPGYANALSTLSTAFSTFRKSLRRNGFASFWKNLVRPETGFSTGFASFMQFP